MKYYFMQGIIFLLATTLFIGCEDDDDPVAPPTDEGVYSFTISGDIEGNFSGEALFSSIEDSETGETGLALWLFTDDQNVDTGDNLWFIHLGDALPPEDTYPIGDFDDLEEDDPDPNQFYSVFMGYDDVTAIVWGESGSITVTNSTANEFNGTFSFSAEGIELETGEEISADFEGEFNAVSGPIVIPEN